MGILLCGLNGAGKSTIGKILAERISYRFIDNEDLYFPKKDKSYLFADPRSKDEAIHILEEMVKDDDRFVFCAVKGDYGEKLLSQTDQIILVEVPKEIRIQRVKARSAQKFGDSLLTDSHIAEKENAWFSTVASRPEDYVTQWLGSIDCPIIRIDGTLPVEENIEHLLSILQPRSKTGST